jgi:transposase
VGTIAQRTKAMRLAEDGLTKKEIARRLGVSQRTIRRWLHPESERKGREASRRYQERHGPDLRENRRRHERENRKKCSCGRLLGIGSSGSQCRRCLDEERHFKNMDFVHLWNEGLSAKVIGERLGLTPGTVYDKAKRLRNAGYPVKWRSKGSGPRRATETTGPGPRQRS